MAGDNKATRANLMVMAASPISLPMEYPAPATFPTECNVPPNSKPICATEKCVDFQKKGNAIIPILPNKLMTAIEIPTSSLSFAMLGATAAIADDPQMVVPKPINNPVDPGQFNFFER